MKTTLSCLVLSDILEEDRLALLSIIQKREDHGAFDSRSSLHKVSVFDLKSRPRQSKKTTDQEPQGHNWKNP